MSGLPLEADTERTSMEGREVQGSDICTATNYIYSITSSASNCIELGIMRLSVFAVLRLRTRSNGGSIGISQMQPTRTFQRTNVTSDQAEHRLDRPRAFERAWYEDWRIPRP